MTDEASALGAVWLAGPFVIAFCALLAWLNRWTLAVTWPLTATHAAAFLVELHTPALRPPTAESVGWSGIVAWHVLLMIGVLWPLPFIRPAGWRLLRRTIFMGNRR